MTNDPVPGTLLGTFETDIPPDFATRLSAILHNHDEHSLREATPKTQILPGAFVFFSFLPDQSWMDKAGIAFDQSLATRRRLRLHADIHTGDHLAGRSIIADVSHDQKGRPRLFVTIATDYHRDRQLVLQESVTYMTSRKADET